MTGSKLQHSVLERYKEPFLDLNNAGCKMRLTFFLKALQNESPSNAILRSNSFRFFFPTKIRPGSPSSFHTWSGHADDDALYGLGCRHRAVGAPGKRFGDHQPAHVLHDSCCRSGAALRHCPTKHRGTSRSDLWLLRVTWR